MNCLKQLTLAPTLVAKLVKNSSLKREIKIFKQRQQQH